MQQSLETTEQLANHLHGLVVDNELLGVTHEDVDAFAKLQKDAAYFSRAPAGLSGLEWYLSASMDLPVARAIAAALWKALKLDVSAVPVTPQEEPKKPESPPKIGELLTRFLFKF